MIFKRLAQKRSLKFDILGEIQQLDLTGDKWYMSDVWSVRDGHAICLTSTHPGITSPVGTERVKPLGGGSSWAEQ